MAFDACIRESLFDLNHVFNLLRPLFIILLRVDKSLCDVKALVSSAKRISDKSGTEFGISLT